MNELFTKPATIVVTCSNRLSSYLAAEIQALNYSVTHISKTAVYLNGTLQDCIQLNIHLRTASQVLWQIKSFDAATLKELYIQTNQLNWDEYFSVNEYFSVTSSIHQEGITTPLIANVTVKDAIVDFFRTKYDERPNSGASLHGVVVNLHWVQNKATLYLDTSGETLAKHGYRKIPGKAPMQESLAAATLMASGWQPTNNVVNPMCGSGTIAIEAALMATQRVPGLYRNHYAFMHLLHYQESFYKEALLKAKQQIIESPNIKIIASDISKDAIHITQQNAISAEVDDIIITQQTAFENTRFTPTPQALAYFNPEYGDRLGDDKNLNELYKKMGDFLKQKCTGMIGCIFTGNLEAAKHIGLKPSKRVEFFNAKIDCRLLVYNIYSGTKK